MPHDESNHNESDHRELNYSESNYSESDYSELNCADFKSRLDAVLDNRRSPQLDLPLSAHARRCPACAKWLATQTSLLDQLQDTPPPEPGPNFAVQVLQTMEVHRGQQRRRRLQAIISLAVAASLLIAVINWRGPGTPDGISNHLVASHPPKIPAEVLQRVDAVSQDFKPVSGSVYTALNAFWLAQRLL
jgi:hypothetical protein